MTPPRRRRVGRLVGRAARVAALAYLGIALLASGCQEWLIFPGARTQGRATSVVGPRHGEVLWHLQTTGEKAGGVPVVALFTPARLADQSPDPAASARPTLLFFYGNGQSVADCRGFSDWFARALDVNVVVGDYPGYGMSGGKPSADGCRALADALYARASADPAIDPALIVPAGLSLGSGVATDLASRRPVAGVMVFCGYTTMDDMARKLLPFLPTRWLLKHHFDNVGPLSKIAAPTLLGHGRRDGLVPFSMHERLVKVAAGPVTEVVNESGHNDFFETKPGKDDRRDAGVPRRPPPRRHDDAGRAERPDIHRAVVTQRG